MNRFAIGAFLAVLAGGTGYALFERPAWLFAAPNSRPAKAEPDLVKRPCGFETKSGRNMLCYDFYVPETRTRADSRRLKLPILVFEAPETDRKSDPVVLISGGPGAIAYTESRYASMWKDKFKDLPWLKGRDLIVYDQRGVGGARPALECPEIDATREDPMNLERARTAMIACRERLEREGVDINAYDTNANADDVLAMQAAFGFKSWNLWGQSYGTRVALTVMRRNPAGVRSVILDGAYPPEVAGKLNMVGAFNDTMERVFAACERDEDCSRDYPKLRQSFEQVLARLRERPTPVKSDPSPLLPVREFQVNDVIFLSIVESILYTADGIGKLPWLIDRVAEGKDDALSDPIVDWDLVAYGPYVTAGISYLVDCNDTPETDDSEERAAIDKQPHLAAWLNYALAVKPCPLWVKRKEPALDRAQVKSDIPTLVIAGYFDIATPPQWGMTAVRSLSRGQLILVRAASHDAADQPCAQSALAIFIETPEADLTLQCGPSPSHPKFKRKAEEE